MRSIEDLISSLKNNNTTPKIYRKGGFVLNCLFSGDGTMIPIDFPYNVPSDITLLWGISKETHLFKDIDSGQWGMEILSPNEVLIATEEYKTIYQDENKDTDFIICRFWGDMDYVLVSCNSCDYGHIYVVTELDSRQDWKHVGRSFTEFLNKYTEALGEKFWEYHYQNK